MLAALGFVAARIAVVHQGVQVHVGHSENVTATAAVTTIGAAKFLVFFVPERRNHCRRHRLQCR